MAHHIEDLYVGEATCLCEVCLNTVQARIVQRKSNIYYVKYCPKHGATTTLVATDAAYFLDSRTPSVMHPTTRLLRKVEEGCPYDCGLCEVHESRSCATILEVTEDCDLRCSTCIAGSHPGAGAHKDLRTIDKMLDTIVSGGPADTVMLSGGEPAIHPQILEIINMACSKAINHVMLITNGRRIAEDESFANALASLGEKVEVYLQFDSLQSSALLNIRGIDLLSVRRAALANLEMAKVPTTLVCVIKKGVNDHEVGSIINYAMEFRSVRGVTFQPLRAAGRTEGFVFSDHYITLTELRQAIVDSNVGFQAEDIIPHPCNPESIAVGYKIKASPFNPVTRELFGLETSSRFSEITGDVRRHLYLLPEHQQSKTAGEGLFRATIVSFLDRYNFSTSAAKRSCIHFVTPDGLLIPFDAYYHWYTRHQRRPVQLTVRS